MALVRQNPLPVGRYWIDIPQQYIKDWQDFLRTMNRGIMVEQTKEHLNTDGTGVTSYLFRNTNPLVPWNYLYFGWPNDATGITDLDQTAQVPGPEAPLFGDWSFAEGLSIPLLILAALWMLG